MNNSKVLPFQHPSSIRVFRFVGIDVSRLRRKEIFVDTCILVALADPEDAWHEVVQQFFTSCLLDDDEGPRFWVTDRSFGEFCVVMEKALCNHFECGNRRTPQHREVLAIRSRVANWLRETMDEQAGLFHTVALQSHTVRERALTLWEKHEIGETDALFVSLSAEQEMALLTVDARLVNSLRRGRGLPLKMGTQLDIYFAEPRFRRRKREE